MLSTTYSTWSFALGASYLLWYVKFLFCSKYFLNFILVSHLTHGLFRNMLFALQIIGTLPEIVLLFISSLVLYSSENTPYMMKWTMLNVLRLNMSWTWSIFVSITCECENNINSVGVERNVLCASIGIILLFRTSISSLIFYLFQLLTINRQKTFYMILIGYVGLPRWLSGKEFMCQCRRCGFDPWVGKIP